MTEFHYLSTKSLLGDERSWIAHYYRNLRKTYGSHYARIVWKINKSIAEGQGSNTSHNICETPHD